MTNKAKNENDFFIIGNSYFIRTVTHHYVGKLIRFNREGAELIFTEASWIPDDGRFHNMLMSGEFCEIEPYPTKMEMLLNRDTIIDAVRWDKPLPKLQK